MAALNRKKTAGTLGPEEAARLEALRADWSARIMGAEPADLFRIQPVAGPPPQRARMMASLACEACGEKTMESRTRRFDGKILCLSCFAELDNRM
jgi:formylmethanofuran dehydrogenase subunit E